MADTKKVTYVIKDTLAVVKVVTRIQLTPETFRVTTNEFVLEIPDNVIPSREYIMGRINE